MIKIRNAGKFDQMYRVLVENDPDLRELVFERVELFKKDPDDTRLQNHKLTKKLKGQWAFSITDNLRIVYKWQGKNVVRFLTIGTHPQVYPRKTKLRKN